VLLNDRNLYFRDNVELARAIIRAYKEKDRLVIIILRMRYKNQGDAWNDIIKTLEQYKIPFRALVGKGIIKVWSTTIFVKGCYTTNSTDIAFLGFGILSAYYGIVVFEEAREFDQKTVNAVLVAIVALNIKLLSTEATPMSLLVGSLKNAITRLLLMSMN